VGNTFLCFYFSGLAGGKTVAGPARFENGKTTKYEQTITIFLRNIYKLSFSATFVLHR